MFLIKTVGKNNKNFLLIVSEKALSKISETDGVSKQETYDFFEKLHNEEIRDFHFILSIDADENGLYGKSYEKTDESPVPSLDDWDCSVQTDDLRLLLEDFGVV